MKNTDVLLKPFQVSYASAFYKILKDKDFLRYWSHKPPSSLAEEKKIIKDFLADKSRKDFAIFFHNKLVGFIGVMPNFKKEISYIEIGYGISKKYWGKGITTSALKQILERLEKKAKRDSSVPKLLVICTHPENKGSQRVALKNGFKEIKNLRIKKLFSRNGLSDFVSEKYLNIVLSEKRNSLFNPIS